MMLDPPMNVLYICHLVLKDIVHAAMESTNTLIKYFYKYQEIFFKNKWIWLMSLLVFGVSMIFFALDRRLFLLSLIYQASFGISANLFLPLLVLN